MSSSCFSCTCFTGRFHNLYQRIKRLERRILIVFVSYSHYRVKSAFTSCDYRGESRQCGWKLTKNIPRNSKNILIFLHETVSTKSHITYWKLFSRSHAELLHRSTVYHLWICSGLVTGGSAKMLCLALSKHQLIFQTQNNNGHRLSRRVSDNQNMIKVT